MISIILMIAVAVVLAITLAEARRSHRRQRRLERELERHREAAQSILRELLCVAACVLIAAGNARADGPTVTACTPSVSVVVPAATSKAKAASHPGEVVQVYWDVSQSMHGFTELPQVVAALDSSVLLLAHANTVEQYGVGATIDPLPSARSALHPTANRTALHLAAEKIGTSLATGTAEAALIVSDLELDTPPRTSSGKTVCGGVPLPSTPLAGSLFGRCFENAINAKEPSLTRANLLVHLFRKSTHGRELFILLFATNRAFGLRISDEITRRLTFTRHVIFDSGAVAAGNVRGCMLTMHVPDARPRIGADGRCALKCFENDAVIQSACDVRSPVDAWITPTGTADDGASFERGTVRFTIPCSASPGRFNASVSFQWQRSRSTLAQNESVRDLLESLADAIVNTTAPRRLRIGIDVQ